MKRSEKFGGTVCFESYDAVKQAYVKGELHPSDLKTAVTEKVNGYLEPIREHFINNKKAAHLLEQVQSFKITR